MDKKYCDVIGIHFIELLLRMIWLEGSCELTARLR